MLNIKKKFINGVVWEAIGRFSALGIQFVVTILIARLLTPDEFGVVGVLSVFIALGSILLDSGFSQALIQNREASKVDLSTIFFLNIVLGFLLYFALFCLSPFIEDFYEIPNLANYAKVLFLIIPINSFGLIQNVILQKELAFKKTATASLLSAIFSGGVGVTMAYNDYGVWALVFQQLSLHTTKTILFIILRRWFPIFKLSIKSIQEMFFFSMNLMLHSIVNTVMKNIYALVIGKFFPISQVGYYNQAYKFQEISASTISQVVLKVSFPALVQKKDNIKLLQVAYSKIFTTTIFLIAPLMVFLICIGEPLFRLLLTDKWLPAVPYFKILCVFGMMLPLLQVSYNLYKIFKRGKLLLGIDIIRHLLVVVSILITLRFNVKAMLIGLVISTFLVVVLNLYKSGKLISLSLFDQLKKVIPYYFFALSSGVVVSLFPNFDSDFLTISFKFIVFFVMYIAILKRLKIEGYIEFEDIIIALKKKKIGTS